MNQKDDTSAGQCVADIVTMIRSSQDDRPQQESRLCITDGNRVYTTTFSINSYYTSYHLPSDEVFQNRTFAGALTTDHRYLRQVELHVHAQLGERILQLIHDGYQLFHAHVAGHRAAGTATAAETATIDELEEVCRL